MRGKVIKIENEVVSVGVDGKIEHYNKKNFNFEPILGDEVEIFKSDEEVIVSKTEKTEKTINFSINTEPEGVRVNKWVYIILILVGGSIGIHKFYVGKMFQGILYLLFCWTFIPTILSFISLIITLFKTSDSNGNIVV